MLTYGLHGPSTAGPGGVKLNPADSGLATLMLLKIWLPPFCHPATAHPLADVKWVLYLPRRVMKIAMTMLVVAWECKELILPE